MPRRVLHGGLSVDGHQIPAGIDVGVPAYSIQRNGAYYASPHSFQPERWMPHAEGIVGAKLAFCAFSLGRMNCIGKNVAYLAMKLATAKLLYAYDIKVPEDVGLVGGGAKGDGEGKEREGEYQMIDWMIGYRSGPIVQFRKREVKA
jgi:cytochrome P450